MTTYLLALYDNEKNDQTKTQADMAAMMDEYWTFTESIKQSGNYLGGEALHPTATASTVRVREGKRLTTDGPFAETKEQLLGFYVIDCKSLDEAIETARELARANMGGSFEIRPIAELNPGSLAS